MAEGWLRHFAAGRMRVSSAGTIPKDVHPLTVRVMAECGIDISAQPCEHVYQYAEQSIDAVITVCDRACEACPTFPNAKRLLHQPFDDPEQPGLNDSQLIAVFRQVRDQIRDWAQQFIRTEFDP